MDPDAREQPREVPPHRLPIGRAAFLATVGAGALGVAALSVFGGVGRAVGDAGGAIPGLDAIAPQDGWRIYNVQDPMPTFDPASYVLEIGGLVERPVRLSWADVEALPRVDRTADFHCVTGWSVDRVRWQGIAPRAIVDLVRPHADARHVAFHSLERPYVDWLTLDQMLLPDVLLATRMDGGPLSRPHGSPLRLVVPRMYGYKSVKWVGRIDFASRAQPGYWEQRGYDADAWVDGHAPA
jgi:DMSO/TMAO reductase YedYZ molybdopterin-dependent catalytic subunit